MRNPMGRVPGHLPLFGRGRRVDGPLGIGAERVVDEECPCAVGQPAMHLHAVMMHFDRLAAAGADLNRALNGGYHLAFLLGAIAATIAAVLAGAFVRTRPHETVAHPDETAQSVSSASR